MVGVIGAVPSVSVGAAFTPLIVRLSVAVSVPPLPSLTV
jgi:hypothetical protein